MFLYVIPMCEQCWGAVVFRVTSNRSMASMKFCRHMSKPIWRPRTYIIRTGRGVAADGDPLRRDRKKVAADLAAFKISTEAASEIYGVVMTADGKVNDDATEKRRQQLQRARISSDVA